MRKEIIELDKLGRMPNESLSDPESIDTLIDKYADLLDAVTTPITKKEGEILIKIFPDSAFYDLEWSLLQLIESLYSTLTLDDYKSLIAKCPSEEWKEALETRLNNKLK